MKIGDMKIGNYGENNGKKENYICSIILRDDNCYCFSMLCTWQSLG